MAQDDPPLPCVGSVHTPGCDHFPATVANGLPPAAARDASWEALERELTAVTAIPPTITGFFRTLDLVLRVRVTRRGRHRCPGCGKIRQLLALTAFSDDQPVGYGTALCRACADLRP